jgi:hypothetical protein
MRRFPLLALGSCLTLLLGTVCASAASPSFVNDVIPVLTRLGCNQGACHGKNSGQNGFRLSLRGYAPEWDHHWITREFDGRRINRAAPEDSLFLLKPLGRMPHGGGKLLSETSQAGQVLLDWLKAGAPGPDKDDPLVVGVSVTPSKIVLQPGEQRQLTVTAEYSDSEQRDVTWLTRFESNDPGMTSIDAAGTLRVIRPGETALRATFQGQVAVGIVTAPYPQSIPADRFAGRNNFIDDHLFAKLAALHIEPSGLCSDAAFLRRASLDTIGCLPTPDQVRTFLADQRADKRSQLIESLLQRTEFDDYWAVQLGDLFQNRKERDHDVRGAKGVRAFHAWLRQQLEARRAWDDIARAVLTAQGKATEQPAVGYFVVTIGENGDASRSELVASVAQAFLGTRIGCAQCHNHPLERYTQDDYYRFAAFFSRIRMERRDPRQAPTTLLVSHPDPNQNRNPVGVHQPRTGKFLAPRPLDRSAMTVVPGEDPRARLASWMTDPNNEYFSGAMVNRLWRHFFGTGLVEPVDDLRASNPPSNPELWQALNHEFVAHKFDLRHLMRVILNSRAYQLDSATRPGNATDTRFFSHFVARRLPAEVLLDALSAATGIPDVFPGYPVGLRALQLPDPTLKSYFLSLFGRSERVTACACERNGEVTMPQLLHLQNGDTVVRKIAAPDGRLGKLLAAKRGTTDIIDDLYLATLSRPPADAEKVAINNALATGPEAEVLRDLFWALLNAKEFSFNH